MRSRTLGIGLRLCGAMTLMALLSCSSPKNAEKPISPASPQARKSPEPSPNLPPPPPTLEEVTNALHRVFGDDLMADRATRPFFIVGDFNGDSFQDLAVIVRPARDKLQDINSELANWIIQDADAFFIPPPNKRVVSLPVIREAKVAEGEVALAIIHGHGVQGWRNADARQAYLVKHAAATFLGTAPSISQKTIRAMHLPVATDIIKEVRKNKKGFLFWTGSAYAWHPNDG
jgi:hypothetical protein